MPRFAVAAVRLAGRPLRRRPGTGYTGEDGVECAVPAEVRPGLLAGACSTPACAPAGLGARDTLRLEAGLPLHGHELGPGSRRCRPGWAGWWAGTRATSGAAQALEARAGRAGRARRLRGLVADGPPAAPRRARPSLGGRSPVGTVTSGNFSPCSSGGSPWPSIDTDAGVGVGDAVTPSRCAGTRWRLSVGRRCRFVGRREGGG